MRLAIVVQRYGADLAGGSEAHCRAVAERLAAKHDVTVLSSCARNYVTWRNEYPAGERRENGVRVIRFRSRKRRMSRFAEISDRAFAGDCTVAEEQEWFRQNGPQVPKLLRYLERHGTGFDRVLFWTFRYYPSFFGLPLVADRAILVPTAEADPAIRLRVLEQYFSLPRGLLFLTPEEADLVGRRCGDDLPPFEIIGTGLEPARDGDGGPGGAEAGAEAGTDTGAGLESSGAAEGSAAGSLEDLGIEPPFLLYLGRIDPNKGCRRLVRYFMRYQDRGGKQIPLVLAGKAAMSLPEHHLVRPLGYVSDAVRDRLLSTAQVLMVPSPYESLCIALLEGWNHGRPALANGSCAVLKGQMLRANGGLFYRNYEEFSESLDLLLDDAERANLLGAQGRDYVDRNYRWPLVMRRIEEFLGRPER